VLSTDSEFHSFRRQAQRLQEAGQIELTQVPVHPIEDFSVRFAGEAMRGDYDFIFLSMVFYNSGFVVTDLSELVQRLPERPVVVVDGYHAFCALPVSLSAIDRRVFYLAGGYKYAQSGEGVCFMYVPSGCELRPRNTGWFASFGELENARSSAVHYSDDGMRFAGATFDPSGIYRFNAVMELFEREGITIAMIHEHVRRLQERFLGELQAAEHPLLSMERLLYRRSAPHGHFLTFVLPSVEQTADVANRLAEANITVDYRGNRLRFGFGLYQDESDIVALFRRLAEL
jgi:selenocysteine lyase/cysteine desulfurase